jgi:hypothetical protein
MRRLFALVVVVLHVLVLALLMSGMAPRLPQDPELPIFVSQWIEEVEPPPPERTPEAPLLPARPPPGASRSPVRVDTPPAAESTPAVSTTISVPTRTPESSSTPQADWAREGKLAARRAAEKLGDEQPTTFSPPPRTVPKPCKPKESSMEWNGEEDRRVTWAGPIPVVKVGKRCVWALVFVACNLSEIPEPNSHLLDDMRAADRPRSSVPDPNICD